MKFKEFKHTLKFKNYHIIKIIIRFIEFKLKNYFYKLVMNFNYNKQCNRYLNLGNYKDNRFINFIFFSLKDNFCFTYEENDNVVMLIKKIGLINFIKYTCNVKKIKDKNKIINIKINDTTKQKGININTDYFNIINKKIKNDSFIMPYYLYPNIYNFYYNKIKIDNVPKFKIFFSGGIFKEVYSKFKWNFDNLNKIHINRVQVIDTIIKEFKSEIYFIKNKSDLKSNKIFKKKIILCLNHKMLNKKNYILNIKKNNEIMSKSSFNLNCPGVVMPLCHHLIEGIKLGSIPITPSYDLIYPNLNEEICLKYNDKNTLIRSVYSAMIMRDEEILAKKEKLKKFYNTNLSPNSFKIKFLKNIKSNNPMEIWACNDHESVERIKNKF